MAKSKFSQRLAGAVSDARITQDELAKRLGVSRALVSHWITGQRSPDTSMVRRIAKALRIDERWFMEEEAPGSVRPLVGWNFPGPIPGQRDFGNANIWTVPADIETLVREAGQNSRDAADDKSAAIVMRFKLIELRGVEVEPFLKAAGFGDLKRHIQAAAGTRGKLARKLAAGLKRVEDRADRLLILRIDDFGTKGLTGPEAGSGSFAALVRNNLDSEKQTTGAGGSFGLGKAAHWRCSDLSTVFFNTVTEGHTSRVIARAELTYHELDNAEAAGPGWFGKDAGSGYAESVDDHALADALHLTRDPLPRDLAGIVSTTKGASILIMAFQDPGSEEPDDPAVIVNELERYAALNFWPAIQAGKLAVVVEHETAGVIQSHRIVDPRLYVPDFCKILDKHEASDTVESFQREGDVVAVNLPIRLPRCRHDRPDVLKHPAVEATATLLVGLTDPEEMSEATVARLNPSDASRLRMRRAQLNSVALVRGPLMVTQYAKKEGILVGARPFHALLLAGEAAGPDPENKFVEQFLRAAEPPAHDRWFFTDDLREMYDRGARTRLEEFLTRELAAALRRILRIPTADETDGPEELRKLLNLGGGTGDSAKESVAVLRNVIPELSGSEWSVKADVVLRKPVKLVVSPYLAINAESGHPVRLHWKQIELVMCPGVKQTDQSFRTDGTVMRFTFKGTADTSTAPVDHRRCSARLALTSRVLPQPKGKRT